MAPQGTAWLDGEAQWEYAGITEATLDSGTLVERMVEAGAKGWELVGFASADPTIGVNVYTAVLKRRVVAPPPPYDPAPAWWPDPTGRFAKRWWDGHQWTAHVATATDPAVDSPSMRARDQ
jgi:Protein of unknown function (DUF2510)